MPGLMSREAALLLGGITLLVGLAFVGSRLMRSINHGISIRLQLFFAIWLTSLMATGVIGFWVIDRLEVRAAELAVTEGPSVRVVLEILREFGPKITLITGLLGVAAAGAAFAFGRAVGEPLERLTRWADAISEGQRQRSLPSPAGREVRRLTAAFDSMRRSLDERIHIERFAADLSHELKNPVSAIRAATEVLLEGAAEDEVARERFLGRIDEASRRLEGLIDDVLALARLEARHTEMTPEMVQVDEVLRKAVAGQTAALEGKCVECKLIMEPVSLRAEGAWLRRAVDNLLVNAIRYSPMGGTIHLRLEEKSGRAVVTVSDAGPGVSDAMRDRLFERFVTDRKEPNQTGLGLAIVRTVAELHDGVVRLLDSEEGARFELELGDFRPIDENSPSAG